MGGALRTGLLAAGLMTAAPVLAQFSDSYSFLKAVRDGDAAETQKYLDKPGAPAINSRDPANGETVLHILVRRHDTGWLPVMLQRGAQVDARDNNGDTPLITAATLSDPETARLLIQYGANVNAADTQGETPLIVAVQHRDLPTIRLLMTSGANPKLADRLAGKSARDYAAEDTRGGGVVLKLLEEAKPRAGSANVAGPMPH
jgi:ankyrin repeat protein